MSADGDEFGQTYAQRIRVLEAGHHQLTEQLAEVTVVLRKVEGSLSKGDSRMGDIERDLAANSAVTREVRDILSAAKGFFKVVGWLTPIVKWLLAASAAMAAGYAAVHNGKMPWQ